MATTYREDLHPRESNGRFRDKGAAWLADNPLMTRKGQIGSSAATAATSLFLMVDSIFKFVMAIFTVGTVTLLSWSGIRYAKKRRHGRGRPVSRVDRMLGTVKATSSNWAAPRNVDAKRIVARAQARELRANGRAQRRGVRRQERKDTRHRVYAKASGVAAGWASGLRAYSKPVPSSDPFVMSKAEMTSAADSIGLRLEGRRVKLLDVNESAGTALVVDKGAPRNVPVGKLDWDES